MAVSLAPAVFAARRARLLELLGPRAALVLASAPERLRNGDTDYKFRQDSDVLYLTGFWGMKGYDACVFPREGEPILITIEASEEDAARTAWTDDVRLIRGYDPEDPRPPLARTRRGTAGRRTR